MNVDYVVKVDKIGDPSGIAKGATRYTRNPKELLMAEYASKVIVNSRLFQGRLLFPDRYRRSNPGCKQISKE